MFTDNQEILQKLDSMTKYPSSETLHASDGKGRLTLSLTPSGEMLAGVGHVSGTEKIDGTNARILCFPFNTHRSHVGECDWFLGSRDNLVAARDDRIPNPAEGIAAHLTAVAERIYLSDWSPREVELAVFYGELYGGRIGHGAKNYARDGAVGFRVFDIRLMNHGDLKQCLALPRERIASLRDHGDLPGIWFGDWERAQVCTERALEAVPSLTITTPPPTDLHGAYEWLRAAVGETTHGALGNNQAGRPEGVVVRTPDRMHITKLRLEDYERTLRIGRFACHS